MYCTYVRINLSFARVPLTLYMNLVMLYPILAFTSQTKISLSQKESFKETSFNALPMWRIQAFVQMKGMHSSMHVAERCALYAITEPRCSSPGSLCHTRTCHFWASAITNLKIGTGSKFFQ